MKYFKCKDKYKLVLSWDRVEYKTPLEAVLVNPRFSGPALSIAAKINSNDFIDMDITSQHIILINSWDIVRFSWEEIVMQDSQQVIFLAGKIYSPEVTKVKLLSESDCLYIDTENHEDNVHDLNLVYKAVVIKRDGSEYDYKEKHSEGI